MATLPRRSSSDPTKNALAAILRAMARLDRLARVSLAQSDGLSQSEALRAERIPSASFWRHRQQYKSGGLLALMGKPTGRPRKA
jgi:hypothetical protein